MERSEKILQGLGNQYYRATLKSMGFTTEDLKRPVIGIANAWSECVPGHYNLRQVAQRVKDGIYRAGGTPIEFGVIGGCDGMGQGHDGNCNGYRCYSIYQFFHDVVLFGFIPIDPFFMKNYEYSRVILRSLLQIKSHNSRGGNAVPARNTAFFFQVSAMGITQLFHKPPLQLLP